MPIINALGWDSSDPNDVVPEYLIGRGRVDFALLGLGRRPAVFIEVKGVGRGVDGDRQLFEYAFHEGVPLCVLTDGRDWSFYLPSGQGSYEDRRLYRLQLDDRDPEECQRVLDRYLSRDRVRSGAAFEDAQRDYRDAAGRREAAGALPKAWNAIVLEPESLLIELVGDQAEGLCGFRPLASDIRAFLQSLKTGNAPRDGSASPSPQRKSAVDAPPSIAAPSDVSPVRSTPTPTPTPTQNRRSAPTSGRTISFRFFAESVTSANANEALIEILRRLAVMNVERIALLAEAVRGRSRNHVAKSVEEIYPARPDLARAAEFSPGWLIGLNIANRQKMAIIRTACDIYGLRLPDDLDIALPFCD